ncbi:biotin--[acetyl-CoA-carboxylase] ligase [Alkalihalobacillus sp. MEB130]|uniref:biotin--[acetyl-CoA-carboxylase] ligase n=1 Tax=Alkalihalobacillus sp. MEB130 TaxID=2976704 RepID=UPI0028E0667D|nr:biotin--[acetyl-CoA-carboxylase] ligase [Alkalihalobacillus sp. MEB130]MDT8859983.1 biotin--[acetyl-CoA-carboxylase] ligase [Alkalihalobacillus sp. MEB130]
MKEKLLKIFADHPGQFVSGEMISQQVGCSRTAVWKHIDELRKNGYELESAPRKGYRLVSKGDGIHPHEVKVGLTTSRIGREITYFDATDSTQFTAHKLAQDGVGEGHVVIANEQTSGKGRLGRNWFSRKGTSISMSIILRPKLPPQKTPQLTLLTAVAVVRAIKKLTQINCDIKWPNDVLLDGKKLVGILTEMQADPDQVHSVIIGIGINVNQQKEDFDPTIQELATSLAIVKGETVERAQVISAVLNEFEELYDLYVKEGFGMIRTLWEANSISVGTYLYARTMRDVIYGFAKGITNDGVLIVEDQEGQEHYIYSADIEIASQSE